jgi:cation diffusion facilitator CzcD-associated flavoprotein CzcO
VIIGAGMSGICLAIRLKQAGFANFVVLEKSPRPGGTWNENTYPGCGCDVPSFLYSFSFAPKYDWSRRYAPQPEIFEYFQDCIRRFGVESHFRYETAVERAEFDEQRGQWEVSLADGTTEVADVVISAVGQLNIPSTPEIPGQDQFQGVQFHSAKWNHEVDLAGKKVAIVGNAASTIQLLRPVAELAEQTYVFQRSPNYVMPKNDYAYPGWAHAVFRHVPFAAKLYRLWTFLLCEAKFLIFRTEGTASRWFSWKLRTWMKKQLPRPLQKKAIPRYSAGCKRILLSDDYFQTLQRQDLELVTEPIESIDATGLNTSEQHRDADVIVYATGFVSNPLLSRLPIIGRGGQNLQEAWKSKPLAYLGLLTPGFPNFFVMYGPNTNLGHNSIIYMVEAQTRYVVECLRELTNRGGGTLEVKEAAAAAYREQIDRRLEKTIWATGCTNWYRNAEGVIVNNWCGPAFEYRWRTRKVRTQDLTFQPQPAPKLEPTGA